MSQIVIKLIISTTLVLAVLAATAAQLRPVTITNKKPDCLVLADSTIGLLVQRETDYFSKDIVRL